MSSIYNGPQLAHIWVEDTTFDGEATRQVIVTDGAGGWWIDSLDGNGPLFRDCPIVIDRILESESVDEAAELVRLVLHAGIQLSGAVALCRESGEEFRNPAWDRFFTLEEAEVSEANNVGGDIAFKSALVI